MPYLIPIIIILQRCLDSWLQEIDQADRMSRNCIENSSLCWLCDSRVDRWAFHVLFLFDLWKHSEFKHAFCCLYYKFEDSSHGEAPTKLVQQARKNGSRNWSASIDRATDSDQNPRVGDKKQHYQGNVLTSPVRNSSFLVVDNGEQVRNLARRSCLHRIWNLVSNCMHTRRTDNVRVARSEPRPPIKPSSPRYTFFRSKQAN
jgi:hypothetical protein